MEVRGLERKDSQLRRAEAVPSLHGAGLPVNTGPIMGRCAWEKPAHPLHSHTKEKKDAGEKSSSSLSWCTHRDTGCTKGRHAALCETGLLSVLGDRRVQLYGEKTPRMDVPGT